MKVCNILVNNYNIGTIIKIEVTQNGSGGVYYIQGEKNEYIAKEDERFDFVKIYDKVQNTLNKMDILQSKIIRTKEDKLITSEGLALYEFIEGDNLKDLNENQLINAIKYIKKYNEALKLVPFDEKEISLRNHWDKARSLDFILSKFTGYLAKSDLDVKNKENIKRSIKILDLNRSKITGKSMQLIHADLGPDNFMFKNDDVVTIIDFTPEYNHELYSLAQFIYWNLLWYNQEINNEKIKEILTVYNLGEYKEEEFEILYLLLIRSSLFRISGPFIEILKKENKSYDGLEKRFMILENLLLNYED